MSYLFELVSKNKESLEDLYYNKNLKTSHLAFYTKGSIKACEAQTIYSVILDKGYKKIVDIGTGPGFSSLYMAQAICDSGLKLGQYKLYSIDIVRSKILNAKTQLNHFGLSEYVKFFCEDATMRMRKEVENGFDFVLIDGNHGYDSVLENFKEAQRIVRPGGCIAFDDVFPRPDDNPGARQIVDSLILDGKHVEFVDESIFDLFSYDEDVWEVTRLHTKWSSREESFCIREKSNPKETLALYFVD